MGDFYSPLEDKQSDRFETAERMLMRGVSRKPVAPRDVFIQSGPRGLLVNWRPPQQKNDIAGWRIYKDDERSLFAEIHEPGTAQHFIETTAGSAPPVSNIFISSINKLGIESPLVQAQGAAIIEAGAPTMPHTPPTYSKHGLNLGDLA